MVTKERKWMPVVMVTKILHQKTTPGEKIKILEAEISNLSTREPNPSPPEGGISLRAAERKYGIKNETLSLWTKKGYIPILLRTKNKLYVDEAKVVELVNTFKINPGRGKWTVRKALNTT